MKAGQPREALPHFLKADQYPENLSVGRPKNEPRSPQVAYCTAAAYPALGEDDKAEQFYRKAADQPGSSRWPEARFYQAMSLARLGQGKNEEARKEFTQATQLDLAQPRAAYYANATTQN